MDYTWKFSLGYGRGKHDLVLGSRVRYSLIVLNNELLPFSCCILSSLLLYLFFLHAIYVFLVEWSWQFNLRDPFEVVCARKYFRDFRFNNSKEFIKNHHFTFSPLGLTPTDELQFGVP